MFESQIYFLDECPGSAEKVFFSSSSSLAVFQLCSAQVHRRPGFLTAGTEVFHVATTPQPTRAPLCSEKW